jgi:hypothetical protein
MLNFLKLNEDKLKKFGKNTLLFLAPVLVIYLGAVIVEINQDGFSWNDFVPSILTQGAMVLYLLNVALDYLKKLQASK